MSKLILFNTANLSVKTAVLSFHVGTRNANVAIICQLDELTCVQLIRNP